MKFTKLTVAGLLACGLDFATASFAAYNSKFQVPSFEMQARNMRGPFAAFARRSFIPDDNTNTTTENATSTASGPSVTDIASGMKPFANMTAGELWDNKKQLYKTYFTKWLGTIMDTNSGLFFNEFLDAYADGDPFGCKEGSMPLSQVRCFIRTYTGDLNWDCRIDSPLFVVDIENCDF